MLRGKWQSYVNRTVSVDLAHYRHSRLFPVCDRCGAMAEHVAARQQDHTQAGIGPFDAVWVPQAHLMFTPVTGPLGVIRDRADQVPAPVNVRSTPEATEVVRRCNMLRSANRRHSRECVNAPMSAGQLPPARSPLSTVSSAAKRMASVRRNSVGAASCRSISVHCRAISVCCTFHCCSSSGITSWY